MPLPTEKSFGISYLKQPLFCQQLGIFINSNCKISETYLYNEFLNNLLKYYNYLAEYNFNIFNKVNNIDDLANKFGKKLHIHTFHTHLLNLQQNISQIYEGYSNDRKMNLKRGLKLHQEQNISVIESTDIEPLISLFVHETAHKIVGGVNPNAYNLLRNVYKVLFERNMAKIFYTINNDNEIESGILITFSNRKIIYLFNSGQTKYRKNNGRTLLIHHVLEKYAHTNYDFFDFESPEIPAIAAFYQSFGAMAYPFLRIHYNNLPFWVQIPKEMRKVIFKYLKNK
jgi:hypothetical protein